MSEAAITSRPANSILPRPLRKLLGRVSLRLRTAYCLRGLGTTILAMTMTAALGMAADYAWVLSQVARWSIWTGWLGFGGLVFLTTLRPLVRRFGVFDLAAMAERGVPELGERLTGAVALLEGDRAPHGSPSLIAALAEEAVEKTRAVKPARAVSWTRAARRLAGGMLALAMLAAPAYLWPESYGTLARRFLMPWADIDRVSQWVVSVAPGDLVLVVGSDLTVSATIRPRLNIGRLPDEARLEWQAEGDDRRQGVAMPPAASPEPTAEPGSSARRFAFTLTKLGRSIGYRVVSGEASSRRHRITALEPPAVTAIAARVEPPAYTKLPATIARDPARITAFEGSRITLDLTPSRPVESIKVGWPKPPGTKPEPIAATLSSGGRSGSVTVVAEASGPYTIDLRDEYGIVNAPEPPRRMIVRPDAPPTVTVRGLETLKEASPDDILTVGFAARDDIAVASIELHHAIHRSGSIGAVPEKGHVAVKPEGLGSRGVRGLASLAFRSLSLKPGDALTYRLRVADNRPAPRGPNVVWTSPEEITIVAGAEPLVARLGRVRRESVKAKLEALKKTAAANRQELERLGVASEAARRGEGRWDKTRQQEVERREADARDLVDRLQSFARDLDKDPGFQPLSRPARQIADLEAEGARTMIDRARQEGDPSRRLSDFQQAGNRLAGVGDRLDELQRKLDAQGKDDSQRGRLQALAARQQKIAEEAQTPGDRAQLDRLQSRQNAVRNDIDSLIRETPDLRGDLLQAEIREAERLAREARALSDRQREESRQAADPAQHAPELKALAEAQRALEDDARRLAMEVDQPLAENGRARLNTEEIRQAAETIERGDIDQARQRLEYAENELRRSTRDIEDVPADPKALAGRLFRRQDALNRDIDEALIQVRSKDKLNAEEKAALASKMKTLARREEEIGRLARTIQPPEGKEGRARFPQEAAREAVRQDGPSPRGAGDAHAPGDRGGQERGQAGPRTAGERAAGRLATPGTDPPEVRRGTSADRTNYRTRSSSTCARPSRGPTSRPRPPRPPRNWPDAWATPPTNRPGPWPRSRRWSPSLASNPSAAGRCVARRRCPIS